MLYFNCNLGTWTGLTFGDTVQPSTIPNTGVSLLKLWNSSVANPNFDHFYAKMKSAYMMLWLFIFHIGFCSHRILLNTVGFDPQNSPSKTLYYR